MLKKVSIALAVSAIAVSPLVAQTAAGPDKAFSDRVKAVIAANPEIVANALNQIQAKQQEAQRKQMEAAVKDMLPELQAKKAPWPMVGNPNAKQAIAEFMDYNCGYCRRAHNDVNTLAATHDVRVIIVMRPILGPDSEALARFALAASLQGKFPQAHNAIYSAQGHVKTDDATLSEMAKSIGLNWEKAKADMAGDQVKAMLAEHVRYAEKGQINGTPFFLTPKGVFPGAVPLAQLESALK